MFIDPFEKKSIRRPYEQKSIINSVSFTDFLRGNGNSDLSAFAAIKLYESAMPFFTSVDLRASSFSQIPIRIWDKKNFKFIDDHPVMELLEKPNSDLSQMEFLEQIASFYDITGNFFIVATGRIEKPPLEIISAPPYNITFGNSSKFGLLNVPSSIRIDTLNNSNGKSIFKPQEMPDIGLRYISEMDDKEIWHGRRFNPRINSNDFFGLTRAQPVLLELEQYISGNNTNLSQLKKGTQMDLAWVNNRETPLTDDQWNRMQEELKKYSGDMNAGKTPILDGFDVKPIQKTNRDMQFKDLQDSMLARVATAFNVPLALVLANSMTLDNLKVAQVQLYDMAVIPLAMRIYGELTRLLMPRYKDSENLKLTLSESDIPALRERMTESARIKSTIGVNTDNELRSVMGDERLESGGDVIWKPSNLIPVAEDGFTSDQISKQAMTEKFIKTLQDKGYSTEKIKRLIIEKFNNAS